MPPPEPFEQFLEDSAGSGERLSTGDSFTLNPEKVWERLANSLAQPEFWLLKIVQAAVVWGAPVVDINVDENSISVEIAAPAPSLDPEALWTSEATDAALLHLRVGVATAAKRFTDGVVELLWHDRNYTWKKESSHPKVAVIDGATQVLRLRAQLPGRSWFGKLFQSEPFEQEFHGLTERVVSRNSRLRWNQAELPVGPEKQPGRVQLCAGASAAYYFERALSLPRYLDWMKSSEYKRLKEPYGSHPLELSYDTFHWVLDGVVIDVWHDESSPGGVAGEFFLSAAEQQLDISGFQVSPTEEAAKVVTDTIPQRIEMLESISADLAGLLDHDALRKSVKNSVWSIDLMVGCLFFPYLLLGVVEIFRLPRVTSRILKEDEELCREHIAKKITHLRERL